MIPTFLFVHYDEKKNKKVKNVLKIPIMRCPCAQAVFVLFLSHKTLAPLVGNEKDDFKIVLSLSLLLQQELSDRSE